MTAHKSLTLSFHRSLRNDNHTPRAAASRLAFLIAILSVSLYGRSDYAAKLLVSRSNTAHDAEVYSATILQAFDRLMVDVLHWSAASDVLVLPSMERFRLAATRWSGLLGAAANDVREWRRWLVRLNYAGGIALIQLRADRPAHDSWCRFVFEGCPVSVPPHWDPFVVAQHAKLGNASLLRRISFEHAAELAKLEALRLKAKVAHAELVAGPRPAPPKPAAHARAAQRSAMDLQHGRSFSLVRPSAFDDIAPKASASGNKRSSRSKAAATKKGGQAKRR